MFFILLKKPFPMKYRMSGETLVRTKLHGFEHVGKPSVFAGVVSTPDGAFRSVSILPDQQADLKYNASGF